MTDIATIGIAAHAGSVFGRVQPTVRVPNLSLWAGLVAIPAAVGQVFTLAYVEPFMGSKRYSPAAPEPDLQGRDPNW